MIKIKDQWSRHFWDNLNLIILTVTLPSILLLLFFIFFLLYNVKTFSTFLPTSILFIMLVNMFATVKISKKLHASNQKLQQANEVIEKSSTVVFEWSMGAGTPVKFVTNNISIFGYTPEDFCSGSIDYWDFVYEADRKAAKEKVWAARKGNVTDYKHIYRVLCKNGDIRWVEEWTLLERDSENNPISEKGILQDITSRKLAEKRIHHLTFHDKLTDVYNRVYYDETLKSLKNSDQYPFSIIIGDMNGLKLTNDTLGHKAGDDLLIFMAHILKKACNEKGVVARIGGDEFAILLPNSLPEVAMDICNQIRSLCEQTTDFPIQPSIALGYATILSPEESIENCIKEADDNMYRNKLNESKSIRSAIISSLQASLEKKTLETKEHAERIRNLSIQLGKALNLSDSQMDELSIAAVMHDIGKIAIPDHILLKPGKLNNEEWEIMKTHTEIGYHIILSSQNMASIASYVLHHHERFDGLGYPAQLKGTEIPIISRIISIIDTFDVITHNRPYCLAKTTEEAIAEIKRCAGSQFDPNIVETFLSIVGK